MMSDEKRSSEQTRFGILLVVSLVSSLIMLDSSIVAVSLPAIDRSLGASFTDVQWVMSAYVLTYVMHGLTCAPRIDASLAI
jgi:MFS family permease